MTQKNPKAAERKRMILYLCVFAAGFIVVSLWSAWLITHPARIESFVAPNDFGLSYEEIALTAKDGVSIAGWYIVSSSTPQELQKPALIIIHGYPAEKGDMLSIAHALHPDFNILLIDLRYFGKSGGEATTLGNKERLDLDAAVDFFATRGFKKVGVLGFSLGGATAIMQAEKDPRIAAVASYGSFANLTLLGKDVYSHLPLIREALIPLMKLWAKLLWGVDASASPQTAAKNLLTPVFLVHSQKDEQIPFRHALLLKSALQHNRRAEFYFLETGSHGELPANFEKRVKDFFLKYL